MRQKQKEDDRSGSAVSTNKSNNAAVLHTLHVNWIFISGCLLDYEEAGGIEVGVPGVRRLLGEECVLILTTSHS